jgi:hypothetical protein
MGCGTILVSMMTAAATAYLELSKSETRLVQSSDAV